MRFAHCAFMGGPGMMGLGLIVIIAVIILVVYLLSKNNHTIPQDYRNSQPHNPSHDEALDVLKMKFVNGEITEEDYLRKRNLLMK